MSGWMYVLALNPCYCADIYDDKTKTMHETIAARNANDSKFGTSNTSFITSVAFIGGNDTE